MKLGTRQSRVFTSLAMIGSMLIGGNYALASDAPLRVVVDSHGADLVEVILTNQTDYSLSVLNWGTPFEPVISHDIFDINSAGDLTDANLAYKGRSVKRSEPLPEDFITLAAGESVQQFLSLSALYTIPEQGDYTVEYNGSIIFQSAEYKVSGQTGGDVDKQIRKLASSEGAENQLQSAQVASETIQLELTPPPQRLAARAPDYFSCSTAQESELVNALLASEEITNVARDGLAGLIGDERLYSPRYRNWFGEYSAERFETVLNTFEAASNVFASEQIKFDCSCDEAGLFAYVFPSEPYYRMYLCPSFWAASVTGTDSRAGTLLHELTHFPVVGGVGDFQYGQLSSARLAITNPDQAVVNADSYEYFAENTPDLPISNLLVFTDIAIGVVESSELQIGESSFYKVTGADYVQLTSTAGDADLYVYDSAAGHGAVCQSLSTEGVDFCEVNSLATAYIEVRGYVASQYSVVAQAGSPTETPTEPETEQEPEGPIVTPEGGGETTTGGNSGEEPVNDGADNGSATGGGAVGFSLLLLFACRRQRLISASVRTCR